MTKHVCVLTGSRAEYGLLRPVMRALEDKPTLRFSLIAAGMHLSREFGYSIKEIINDGFSVSEKVKMNPVHDSGFSMAQAIADGVGRIAKVFLKIKPDILLVLGDRIEPLAATIAAAYMNIPIAHIHGGDVAQAGLDESTRWAITRFAHIHFAATRNSADRLYMAGEDRWRTFVVGAPGLDEIVNADLLSKEELSRRINLNFNKPIIIVVQHSVTTEPANSRKQIIETLGALNEIKHQTIIMYPNSDAGGREIIRQIERYAYLPFIKIFKNLPRLEYLSLLKYGSVLVGNSSSGIIEAPYFKLPVVNIGSRQTGRERSENIIDVDYDKNKIMAAITKVFHDCRFKKRVANCKNPYGCGRAGFKIANILSNIKINKGLLRKSFRS